MSRPDLLGLTPQAIASVSNLGLVKRAQKELEQGKGPRLEELADGTVVGTFEDGITARLAPGKSLKDSPCTCNSTTVCRHRVAVALAYPAFISASSTAPAPEKASEAAPEPPWSPGSVEDRTLAELLPRRSLERAESLRERGYLAQVRRGTFVGEDLPSVALATCTVRFLVPRNLGYARCDCSVGTGCEHLPLAIWAFRAADEKDPTSRELLRRGGEPARRVERGRTGAGCRERSRQLPPAGGRPARQHRPRGALRRGALEPRGREDGLAARGAR
ncbi:hypothetical protein ACN28I_06935 [Archangium gephyra]|uniref:hypothetical protein n=1 Tax=Archangium gephyra TaxID=48 RepID=UPI003B7BAB86